ncbi:hypothetical protein JTB14_036764 [Gonioctena quinquepunctata]|nr:hypothetical protein JTB14_036764 [Gonioctena quinquepunctata]
MLSILENGLLTWIIGGINMNSERYKLFDFTTVISTAGCHALYSETNTIATDSAWISYVKKEHMIIIILIISSVIYVFVIIYCSRKFIFRKSQYKSIVYIIWVIMMPLLEQSYNIKSRFFSHKFNKIIFGIWWFSSYIIINIYKTYRFSSLIIPKSRTIYIDDLVNSGFEFQCSSEEYKFIKEEFVNYPNICENSTDDICETFARRKGDNLALVGEKLNLIHLMFGNCTYLSTIEKRNLVFTPDNIFGLQMLAWPMQKNSKFAMILSRYIDRLQQTGIMQEWYV